MSFKKISRKFTILLLLICFCVFVRAERLPLRLYTSADGMANNYILHVSRDSLGFLWFCTRDGLMRFDGKEFKNYRLRDDQTTQSTVFLMETTDGNYWIAGGDGVYLLQRRETTESKPETETGRDQSKQTLNAAKVSNASVRTIYEDREHRVWGGNADGLILLRDENGQIISRKVELGAATDTSRGVNVRSVIQAVDGSLWIACYLGLVRRLPDGRNFYYPIKRDSDYDETFALESDADGRIYVAHATGLFIFQPEPISELQNTKNLDVRPTNLIEKIFTASGAIVLPEKSNEMMQFIFPTAEGQKQSNVINLFRDNEYKLWIVANNSLYLLSKNSLERITNDSDRLPPITNLVADTQGNLWIGTASGAIKFVREGLKTFDVDDGLVNTNIYSIHETEDGGIYAVLNKWTVAHFDGIKFISTKLQMPDRGRNSWGTTMAMPDRKNRWWAMTTEGLYRFDDISKPPSKTYRQADGLKADAAFCAFEDSHGNLWFSTRRQANENGLTRIDKNENLHSFTTENENYPSGKSAITFAENPLNGDLWLGFYEGGAARLRNGRFELFTTDEGLPAGIIFALHFDKQNRLWIASSREGLSRVDNPHEEKLSFAHLTTNDGLVSNGIRSLTEDLQGNIYAGTIRGVDRINPANGEIKHFSIADGLAADYVVAALSDKKGNLWFGTPNGLSLFQPETDLPPESLPRVFISGLNIAGTRYTVSVFGQREIADIKVAATENNLQINFSGIGEAESLRYQYKINNENWSVPSAEQAVNFANLAPGDYKFCVRAINGAGQPSENPASVSFMIAPPFYRTWWFLTLATLLVVGSVFALDRFRVRKTKQVKAALDDSRRAELAVRESETRYRTLAQTASDVIITIDEDSRIVYVNKACEKVFGFAPETLIGEHLTVLMPEELRPQHVAGFTRYLKTNRKNIGWTAIELPGQNKAGELIPLELSFGEFMQNGKRYFTGIARDITGRKRADEALRKSREERFAELERVRSRIARDLHDDVGSSLTQIALYSEVAKQSEREKKSAEEPLEFLVNVSNELVEAMSDIVWAINPAKDHLHDLTQRMRRYASECLTVADVDFEFFTPEENKDTPLGANLRREVFLIFKESINNIVKHSGATEAEIDFRLEKNLLTLILKDNGKGFNPVENNGNGHFDWKKAMGGNGLSSMKKRAEDLGGEYEIESNIGVGTTVVLCVRF